MNVMERFRKSFSFVWGVGTIEFGPGKIDRLGQLAKEMKATEVLIVTDKGVARAGILKKAVDSLEDAGVEPTLFDEIEPNPLDTTVDKGARLARELRPDLIIGIGGGSPIDSAKAISLLATNPGTVREYKTGGERQMAQHPTPLVAIPTTAGTGTEGNYWSVITNSDTWHKFGVRGGPAPYPGGPCTAPVLAIDDPLLTVTLPPFQTAATGLDAFAHHYDAYTAKMANPISDALSEYSIKLIRDYLPIAYANGNDTEARQMMLLASCLGGISFTNSDCSGSHCLGEALGGLYGNPPRPVLAHGLCCSLFLPWVMEYNCIADPVKHANVARFLGENIQGLSLLDAARKSVAGVKKLIRAVGLPTSLKACDVDKGDLEAIAERATRVGSLPSNPRTLNYEVFMGLLQDAYWGWE